MPPCALEQCFAYNGCYCRQTVMPVKQNLFSPSSHTPEFLTETQLLPVLLLLSSVSKKSKLAFHADLREYQSIEMYSVESTAYQIQCLSVIRISSILKLVFKQKPNFKYISQWGFMFSYIIRCLNSCLRLYAPLTVPELTGR